MYLQTTFIAPQNSFTGSSAPVWIVPSTHLQQHWNTYTDPARSSGLGVKGVEALGQFPNADTLGEAAGLFFSWSLSYSLPIPTLVGQPHPEEAVLGGQFPGQDQAMQRGSQDRTLSLLFTK